MVCPITKTDTDTDLWHEVRVTALPDVLADEDTKGRVIYHAFAREVDESRLCEIVSVARERTRKTPSIATISLNPRSTRRSGPGFVEAVTAIAITMPLRNTDGHLPLHDARYEMVCNELPCETFAVFTPGYEETFVWILVTPADPDDAHFVARRLEMLTGYPVSVEANAMIPLAFSTDRRFVEEGDLVWLNEDGGNDRTTLDEITRALDAIGAPQVPEEERAKRPRRRRMPGPDPLAPNQITYLVSALSTKIWHLIETGWTRSSEYASASAADMAVIRALVTHGLTDGQVAWIFEQYRIGSRARRRDRYYLARTVDKIRLGTGMPTKVAIGLWDLAATENRIRLHLTALDGPHAGTSWPQGLKLGAGIAKHAIRSAGLDVPMKVLPEHVTRLQGRTALVELQSYAGSVQVKRWLPPRLPAPVISDARETGSAAVETVAETMVSPRLGDQMDAATDEIAGRGMRVDLLAFWRKCNALDREFQAEYAKAKEKGDRTGMQSAAGKQRAMAAYAGEVYAQAADDPDGRVRAEGYQEDWIGRLHAHDPPLQQVTHALRPAFPPAEGNVFISGDWSAAQARIAAGLSGDVNLISLLNDPNRDLYRELGEKWARDAADPRKVGKGLFLPLLFLAGPDKLVERAADAGYPMGLETAQALHRRAREIFPALTSWREAQRHLTAFSTPLGRTVTIPPDKIHNGVPELPTVIAAIAQAWESDALRRVILAAPDRLAGTGAAIILLLHDGLVLECPEATAREAMQRIQALMDEALAEVCAPCMARTTVKICTCWE